MEHHLRPLLVITILAILLAGAGYMLWPQTPIASTVQNIQQASSTVQNQENVIPWVSLAKRDGFYFSQDGKVYVPNDLSPQEIPGADATTFMVLDSNATGSLKYIYAKDKNHVYYRTRIDGSVSVITAADPATFNAVAGSDEFDAKDSQHRYWSSWIICEDPTHATCTLWDGPGEQDGHWFPIGNP